MKENKLNIKYFEIFFNELEKKDKDLIDAAVSSAKNAYAPYSKFYVGAAVRLTNNKILKANNQENAAYPSGLCAERIVMFYANANNPKNAVDTMAIVVINEKNEIINENISPCGACRQVIAESEATFKHPIRILLVSKKSILVFNSIQDLLPFSFNQGDLERK